MVFFVSPFAATPHGATGHMSASRDEISQLLGRWRSGESSALDQLMPLVYEELRRLARSTMRGEGPGHVLQTTALVHEAYLRLVDAEIPFEDRVHFFAVAARMMRRLLVDHARNEAAAKRGGAWTRVTLGEEIGRHEVPLWDILHLDAALERLAEQDVRKARAVELRYYAGMTSEEIGAHLGVAAATARSDLRLARAWLLRELRR